MIIVTGMDDFQNLCKGKFVEWFNKSKFTNNGPNDILRIEADDVFVVWACKTLQNYKCIVGTRCAPVIAEYTYNGDDKCLYEGIYKKISNISHSTR